jgi:Ras GTPase-activating-like protein IQGAP2/3
MTDCLHRAPDNFGIVEQVLSPSQRQALAAVSQLLNQVSKGALYKQDSDPTLNSFNEYIARTEVLYQDWVSSLMDVPDAEEALHADVYSEHTAKRPVIYISPNEIYLVHSLLMKHSAAVVPSDSDRMQQILAELGSPPPFQTDELNRARSGEVELALVSRMEPSPNSASHIEAMWTSTKRLVLLILKVQPGDNLRHALELPATRDQERIWQQICTAEVKSQRRVSRATSIRVDQVYRLTFTELKEQALVNLQEIQASGRLGEDDDETYQEMLNAIARDIRQKHRKRMQRHTELSSMQHTLSELEGKRKYLDAKVRSFALLGGSD